MDRDQGAFQIVGYRGMLHKDGCALSGRVLQRALSGGPRSEDSWWVNLRNAWRRFDSEAIAGAEIELSFRGAVGRAITDAQGYYALTLPVGASRAPGLWEIAEARRASGGKAFLQPVLCLPDGAAYGVISDIDDTVLESSVTHWQTAAQLALLHNARTRKPLEGVAGLYQAFQRGRDGHGPNPVFYVSASPWNLYDLLEDFLALNGIPPGPILLRDVDLDRASWHADTQARSKVEGMHLLIERYPQLKWVLVGDSGQVDAQLYAETAIKYPGRILAVYIRDIDPAADSGYDRFVDGHIGRLAGSGVPMLRVKDSNAIATHARTLGLIEPEQVQQVAEEVQADKSLPGQKAALGEGALQAVAESVRPAAR